MEEFVTIEPLKSNRWVIKTKPLEITDFLFREYKMYNEGENIIFETSFIETILGTFNPRELMNITDLTIQYLDPVGEVVGGFDMTVKGINFEKHHSYSDDSLLTTNLRFVIDRINPIFVNKEETNAKSEQ